MASRAWYCRCGFRITKRRRFVEHLALDDKDRPVSERHWPVTEEEWSKATEENSNG